jgi:hypothetical protein
MIEWLLLLLLVPAVVLPVVLLLGFAGCGFEGQAGEYLPLVITSATATSPNTVTLTWTGGYTAQIEFQRDKRPKPGQSPEWPHVFVVDMTPQTTGDGGLTADSVYEYRVRQIYGDGQRGEWSPIVRVETPADVVVPVPSVTFDTVSGGHTDSGLGDASTTWPHTASGNAAAVVVGLRWSQTGGVGTPTRTVTYGAVDMTSLGVRGLDDDAINAFSGVYQELFGLRNPPTGAQTVSVTVDRTASNLSFEACSVSYAQVSGFVLAPPVSGTEAGTTMTQPANSAPNEMVVQMFATASGSITAYNQTSRFTSANGFLIGDAPGAAAISFTANRATGVDYAGLAVRLTPVT